MSRPIETLDDAWAALLEGRVEDVIRACLAILDADGAQVGAALLLARALNGEGETVSRKLVDAMIRRGDLPAAMSIAPLTVDPAGMYAAIAKAFGKGSPRAKDVSPAPPPLPIEAPPPDAELKKASKKDLIEWAGAALEDLTVAADPDSDVPIMPLFGAIAPKALEQLLAAWKPRLLAADEVAVFEGDEGKEAFIVVRGHLRVVRGEEQTVLAELGPGAIFGEMSLVSDAPRAASVIANEPVLLLAATREDLEALAKKTKVIGEQLSAFCRARMLSNLMRHSAILSAVDASERASLIGRFETRRFKAGDALVRFEEQADSLFLIASGAVRVLGRDGDDDSLELARLGPGDVVGEIGLVLRRPATADVIATHQTVAMELKHEQFQEAIRTHPELLGELYELATKREEETRTVVAQETLDVEDVVLL